MGIRNMFRSKRSNDMVLLSSSATNDDNKSKPKFELSWELEKENSNERFLRTPPQRTSSTRSEGSCSSTSSTVSFSEEVKVQEIAPMSSLTDVPEELWYQKDEYNTIQKRNRKLAKYMERFEKEEQEMKKLCTRGLESLIEGRSTNKREARRRVLSEQKLQRDMGTFDEEGMALAYQAVSKNSAAMAQERASKDAKAVEVYLRR